MTLKTIITSCFVFTGLFFSAQNISGYYKIDQLLNRLKNPDTTYVVNFWAVWCKPCIQELPSFDSLHVMSQRTKTKILLVSLDFKDEKEKVKSFLIKKNIQAECIVLDEINGNSFIDKISTEWSGAIPATLISLNGKKLFLEKKLTLAEIKEATAKIGQ